VTEAPASSSTTWLAELAANCTVGNSFDPAAISASFVAATGSKDDTLCRASSWSLALPRLQRGDGAGPLEIGAGSPQPASGPPPAGPTMLLLRVTVETTLPILEAVPLPWASASENESCTSFPAGLLPHVPPWAGGIEFTMGASGVGGNPATPSSTGETLDGHSASGGSSAGGANGSASCSGPGGYCNAPVPSGTKASRPMAATGCGSGSSSARHGSSDGERTPGLSKGSCLGVREPPAIAAEAPALAVASLPCGVRGGDEDTDTEAAPPVLGVAEATPVLGVAGAAPALPEPLAVRPACVRLPAEAPRC